MNLKTRLMLIISLLLLLVMVIGMRIMIWNAQEDIRAEVDSTARLAKRMLDTQIGYLAAFGTNVWDSSPFHLQELANLRHLHIEFFNASGVLIDSNQPKVAYRTTSAPSWLSSMLNTGQISTKIRRSISFHGRIFGELVITPDASYEIAEIWNDTSKLFGLAVVFFIFVNMVVYYAVAHALKPVAQIRNALSELGNGKYEARLPKLDLPELEGIGFKFNQMAINLQHSQENNAHLTQQLINLQEEERKSLARNLHDDLSQSLTAIQIEATTIASSRRMKGNKESAGEILHTLQVVRSAMRSILKSLRPGALDELGLHQALISLIDQWREQNPDIEACVRIDSEVNAAAEAVAISIYRLVQESLTNITRHAHASKVMLDVHISCRQVHINIQDDGKGCDMMNSATGFGLLGMRERIQGLGGSFEMENNLNHGIRITTRLPMDVAVK